MGSISALTVVMLVILLGAGVWVGLALTGTGVVLLSTFMPIPVERVLGQVGWNTITAPELVALPMFIFMGEILFRTKLSETLFDGLCPLTRKIPGRLLHVNVLGCTLFAAVSGSSAATTATVGKITSNELVQRGYDPAITAGALAGAGTLGFLIPPSTMMIVYGTLAQVSILKMFLAGIVPGLLLASCFMVYLAIHSKFKPSIAPESKEPISYKDIANGITKLLPVFALITVVIGSMLLGIASPSEAAVVGVVGSIIVSITQGCFSWKNIANAAMGAAQTTSMIGLIIFGAVFLSIAMSYLKVPVTVANVIASLELSPVSLIVMLIVFYIVLGCVLEGMSIIVMTLPITLPLIQAAGFDPIWFGVFLVLVVEMAQITPPVGFNLFVINGITGMPIGKIAKSALPFFIIMISVTVLITLYPNIVMSLPNSVSLNLR